MMLRAACGGAADGGGGGRAGVDAVALVGQGRSAAGVGADLVAGDQEGAGVGQADAAAVVPRDDVAGAGGGAADRIAVGGQDGVDPGTVVGQGVAAAGVDADVVPLDHVARAGALERDPEPAVARDDVPVGGGCASDRVVRRAVDLDAASAERTVAGGDGPRCVHADIAAGRSGRPRHR